MIVKNKKILITGGKGFIGRNLVKKLEEKGALVSIFDLADNHDIQNKNQLQDFIKRKYDVIYHLAGLSGSQRSVQQKLNFIEVNTLAAIDLFELLIKHSPKTKLIISSSRLEYGSPIYLPVDENHPTVPTSTYGVSKLAATQLALIYHFKNNLDVTIFRTSNVYGPHYSSQFPNYNVVNHFIDLAKQGKTIEIFGKGEQKRDYLFIDDLVDAFLLAATQKSSGNIYNLGSGWGIKFKDMANLIIKKIGKGRLKFVKWPDNLRSVETGSYITDITKIKKELGFDPKIDFEEGILKTLNFEIRN